MSAALPLLRAEYGDAAWKPADRPLDAFVRMMLSQNTSWRNANEGFRRLKRDLPTWEKVLAADANDVQRAIAVCGLGRMRSRRLQTILRQIKQERGRLSLAFVGRMSSGDAATYLGAFHGIGPKTIACTLLFGFGMPVFPVDNGILRVLRRLGVVRPQAREAEVQETVEAATEPADRYALHVLTYRHAKKLCRPKNPKCEDCPLLELCPAGKRRKKHAPPAEPLPKRPRMPALFISGGIAKHDEGRRRRGR